MKIPRTLFNVAATVLLVLRLPTFVNAAGTSDFISGMEDSIAIQREGLERLKSFLGPDAYNVNENTEKRAAPEATIEFKNPRAQEFFVDGANLPLGSLIVSHIVTIRNIHVDNTISL